MAPPPIPPCDTLTRFLQTDSAEDAEELIAILLMDHALPVVKAVVARRLAGVAAEVREDVAGDSLAALVGRLRMLRRDPSSGPAIEDFFAYAAGVAGNSVNQYLAARQPERTRLRRRLRMACTTDERLRIWETGQGFWLCGLSRWTGGTRAAPDALEACRVELASAKLPRELADLLARIFDLAGQPVELNDLLSLCAVALGVVDEVQDLESMADRLPGESPSEAASETRRWMGRLWQEIQYLPERQRMALLLNLRTPGGAAIGLFQDLGIATFPDLAAALQVTPAELAEIWDRLPLNDKEISDKIGVERQQVINLRSAARQRLLRRMNELPILWKTAPRTV